MSGEKNVVQCNGPVKHFYDANKYDKCPHCGAAAFNGHEEKKPHGFFGGVFGKNTNNTKTQGLFSDKTGNTINVKPNTAEKNTVNSSPMHQPVQQAVSHVQQMPPMQQAQTVKPPHTASGGMGYNYPIQSQQISTPIVQQNSSFESQSFPEEPVRKTVAETTNNSVNDAKTTGHWYGKKNNDPVVGWLVCVKGENQGESYQIVSGRNTIGRRETNEIALIGENSVSRENHASIFYDYKKSEFYLKPGEGNTMPYVNDDMVTSMTKLNSYDVIEIGDCSLVFVPFCGEAFSWDKYIEKEQ